MERLKDGREKERAGAVAPSQLNLASSSIEKFAKMDVRAGAWSSCTPAQPFKPSRQCLACFETTQAKLLHITHLHPHQYQKKAAVALNINSVFLWPTFKRKVLV